MHRIVLWVAIQIVGDALVVRQWLAAGSGGEVGRRQRVVGGRFFERELCEIVGEAAFDRFKSGA